MLAAADLPQAVAMLVTAGLAAAVLALPDNRWRALSTPAALVAAAVLLMPQIGAAVEGRLGYLPVALAAAAVLGAGLVALLQRRPEAFALLVVLTVAIRVPLPAAGETANLLVPLYVVIAAGSVRYALSRTGRRSRPGAADDGHPGSPPAGRLGRGLAFALAAVIVLYAIQALYSTDAAQAAKNLGFFYVPFAVLFRLLADVRWSRRLVLACFGVATGLALLFAVVGFVEYSTRQLVVDNPGVRAANAAKPYFRVSSLFFDPNVYGRFLAIAMLLVAAALLWSRRTRDTAAAAVVLAVLWAGLVLSLSQSSFAALLSGLAVLAALRWGRPRRVIGAAAIAILAAVAVVALAPATLGLDPDSLKSINRATSGRLALVRGGVQMFVDRPVWGFGSGSFAERYRVREGVDSSQVAVASHSIPVTIAAEQGLIGLAGYATLTVFAFMAAFAGPRAALARGLPPATAVARAGVAAAFAGFVVHTLVYAGFLEDPLAWALLAAAVGLAAPPRPSGRAVPAPSADRAHDPAPA